MLSLPKGFIEKSRNDSPCGQSIITGMYETEDGVDESCMIVYINNVVDYIYLIGEDYVL